MFHEARGVSTSLDDLIVSKARALAVYLSNGKHAFATLIDTRRDSASGIETVVFDVVVEVSQSRVNPILDTERIAVSFSSPDDMFPEVVALRTDFPWVPHLNQREQEFPRSLCLYELPYTTIKLRWTPAVFVERIRQWLSLTADGKLHQDDQPLENVFLGSFPPLILPSDFLQSINSQLNVNQSIRFGVHAVGTDPQAITGFVVANPKMDGVPVPADHIATAVVAPARKHGLIRKTPKTLRQVIDVMQEVDVDLLGILSQRIREWRDVDQSVTAARLLLLLIFPKFREEGAPQETWEWDIWGFLLLDDLGEVGAKIGLWQIMGNGTFAALIGANEERSGEISVQIVNPVTQLTKAAAARFNGMSSVDRRCVLVGVGALGSMNLENLIRKGWGCWSLIDDDLMMPHNGARHALPALASGVPKVTGMKQVAETFYEDTVVSTTERVNILHAEYAGCSIAAIFESADVVFDCTADIAAARSLALDLPYDARRLSLFLSPDGEQLVLLLEDAERQIRLDALEMQFYRLLLTNEPLKDHYASVIKRVRYGRSCRDLSAILPADAIAMFAAIASRAVDRLLLDNRAAIVVWKTELNFSVRTFDAAPRRVFRKSLGDFAIVWDEGVVEKLRWLRGEKLPKETGGALVGCWDLSRQILYIVDVTGAPQDSVELPMAFIRGSSDLSLWLAAISRLTGGAVEYVGEWHSHPDGYSTSPSGDDRQVFRWIEEHLSIDGLPPVVAIVGKTELRWLSNPEGDGDAWKYPS